MFDKKALTAELKTLPADDPKTRAMIINAFNRYYWSRHPNRKAVKERCKQVVAVGTYKNGHTKYKVMYKCEECHELHENVDVDHITPRIDPECGWQGFDTYFNRTIVPPEEMRGLCKGCHHSKTASETTERAKTKRRRKADET